MSDIKVIIVIWIAFEIANYFNIFDMPDSPNQFESSFEESKNNTKMDFGENVIQKLEEINGCNLEEINGCNLGEINGCNLGEEELIQKLKEFNESVSLVKEPEIPSEIPLEKPLKWYLNDPSISSDDIWGYELLDKLIELIKTLFS